MARVSGFLLFFSILLTLSLFSTSVSQTVVESKITIGSSISAPAATITDGNSSFWLSPSGIFSFGFYPINSYYEEYIIGIWINNNPTRKTLVWSMNRDDSPLSNATSLLLNHDGKFVIQFSNGTEDKPLFHQADSLLSSPISYASILVNGNLVFYNSNSTIIWNSFSCPTDTILQGQTLHPKQSLVSVVLESNEYNGFRDMYRLMMNNNGNLMIYSMKQFYSSRGWEEDYHSIHTIWDTETKKKNGSPIELKLDSTGHLYLGDWNGVIMKNLNNGSIDKAEEQQQDKVMYRATLGSDGKFRLYKEKLDGNASAKEEEIHTVIWDNEEQVDETTVKLTTNDLILLYVFLAVVVIGLLACIVANFFDDTSPRRVALGK